MKEVFLYASSSENLKFLKEKMVDAFKDLNLSPEFYECVNCEDSFKMVRSTKFNAYIFYGNESDYFPALLRMVPTPTDKNRRIKLLFESLPPESIDAGAKIIHSLDRDCFSIDKSILSESKEFLASIVKFVFYPPLFFFSYGNEKGKDELGGSAREIIEEIESCFRGLFPNIIPCKDYTCFTKSSIVDNNLESVAKADFVFMVINEKFFKSQFCMREFSFILKFFEKNILGSNKIDRFNEKVLLITSPKADEYMDTQNLVSYPLLRDAWLNTLKEKVNHYVENKGGDEVIAKTIKDTVEIVENCIPFIRNMDSITRIKFDDLRRNGYSDLMLEVHRKLENAGYRTFYSDLHDPELSIVSKSRGFAKVKKIEGID